MKVSIAQGQCYNIYKEYWKIWIERSNSKGSKNITALELYTYYRNCRIIPTGIIPKMELEIGSITKSQKI
ncbi:hypothetical protein RIR_jg36300.t1 [Rhizophagus irregularis DAOM 181602=DAOM 197198]|nr:hypothetical protein RIR_jg36300.t1 [Rhizophagus irregularis DAOM 181602=DAOM 197198]